MGKDKFMKLSCFCLKIVRVTHSEPMSVRLELWMPLCLCIKNILIVVLIKN